MLDKRHEEGKRVLGEREKLTEGAGGKGGKREKECKRRRESNGCRFEKDARIGRQKRERISAHGKRKGECVIVEE